MFDVYVHYSSSHETCAVVGGLYEVVFLCDGDSSGYSIEVVIEGDGMYRTGMDEELTVFTEHVS